VFIRLPFQAHQQRLRLEGCAPSELYPSLDSLNQLGAVPWKINAPLLDLVISIFNEKGDEDLGVPPPPSEAPPPPPISYPGMTSADKAKAHKERLALKRKRAEMYSLWCDALYRLSLANHVRFHNLNST
jgi:DNA-directed RNA polymerase